MSGFGRTLRKHRHGRGLSLRQLGALVTAYQDEETGGNDMHRRAVLQAMGALAGSVLPLVQWESLRHSLSAAIDLDDDHWDEVVADYGLANYRMSSHQVMENLRADLTVLQALIFASTGSRQEHLLRAAARLSVIVALNLVAAGRTFTAGRWWRDAHQYAVGSRDSDSIVLTRAWEVVNGCYDGRPASQIVALADEVLPLLGDRPSAASCGLLAGRAQALSLAGRHDEAIATAQRLSCTVDRLATAVVDDVESLWGWPEHRLRHTEAWVYAHAGKLPAAARAQEQAVALYPSEMARLRTQVQLHHAAALIRSGDISDGLCRATDLLDDLPSEQHNALVRAIARQVIDAVPAEERTRPDFRELTDRVVS